MATNAGDLPMKRALLVLALAAGALAACDDPRPVEPVDTTPPPMEPIAPAAPDAGQPTVAPSAVDAPPVDSTTLPPAEKSSEESVQPESETLFY
jgi:hypothetical protein